MLISIKQAVVHGDFAIKSIESKKVKELIYSSSEFSDNIARISVALCGRSGILAGIIFHIDRHGFCQLVLSGSFREVLLCPVLS